MIKLAGILLAFTACTATGFLKAAEIRTRRKLLLDFRELLLRIATEISYFKEPLPQIFSRLTADGAEREKGETDLLLRSFLTAYQCGDADMGQMWRNAVDSAYEGSPLCREDLAVMKKCGEFLGRSDFSRQEEHFRLLESQMDRQLAEAEENIRTKGRMYSRLGLSAGLVIAVALF